MQNVFDLMVHLKLEYGTTLALVCIYHILFLRIFDQTVALEVLGWNKKRNLFRLDYDTCVLYLGKIYLVTIHIVNN